MKAFLLIPLYGAGLMFVFSALMVGFFALMDDCDWEEFLRCVGAMTVLGFASGLVAAFITAAAKAAAK